MGWLTLLPKLFQNFQDPDVAWVPWVIIALAGLVSVLYIARKQ